MAESSQPAGGSSAFEIVTPSKSKKTNFKSIVIVLLVFVFLAGAIFLGVRLVQQNQEIREKAEVPQCPGAEECPTSDGKHLLNCTPAESDNSPDDSLCGSGFLGRVASCGGTDYCCNGTSWVVSMSACATPTPTASPSASPTPTATIESLVSQSSATPSATPTSTSTATPKSTSTPVPVPETGTSWPTYAGVGLGVVVIVASILLAI